MGIIYKKNIPTQIIDFIRCDKCNIEVPFSSTIDTWCEINKESYCLNCQKQYGVGLYQIRK